MADSPLLQHIAGYIDGQWQPGPGAPFGVTNPASGETLAQVGAMGPEETRAAIAAAERAQAQATDVERRRTWLQAIAYALLAHRDELGRILTREHGKPLAEARGEVDYAAGFFRYAAAHLDALEPHTLAERPRGLRWQVHHRPVGVVALVTPWNFPIGMIAKKLSAALAADCSCVIKPSSKTPLTMIALFHLLDRLKLPAGKVNLVLGPAGPISDTLCAEEAVRAISFTGSTEVGKALMRKAADGVKRLTLELGGNAPFIVFDDADLAAASAQLVANKFRGGGQTCVCSNRVFVQRRVAGAFADRLADAVAALRVGDGLDEGTDIGPLINRRGYDKVRGHLLDALDRGAECIAGGDPGPWEQTRGRFTPTVIRGVTPAMRVSREETFGPLLPIAEFADEAEVLAHANDTPFGLAAYFFTRDRTRADRLAAGLQFGHVGWNSGSGPTPEAPFGGMKQSGLGREGGREGLFEFTETQTLVSGASE